MTLPESLDYLRSFVEKQKKGAESWAKRGSASRRSFPALVEAVEEMLADVEIEASFAHRHTEDGMAYRRCMEAMLISFAEGLRKGLES